MPDFSLQRKGWTRLVPRVRRTPDGWHGERTLRCGVDISADGVSLRWVLRAILTPRRHRRKFPSAHRFRIDL